MTKPELTDTELDLLLRAARRDEAALPADLAQRMQADAARVQNEILGRAARPARPARPGLWAVLRDALGGWPGMAGLATACAAGVWIGLAPPAMLPDPLGLVQGGEAQIDLFGQYDVMAALTAEEAR